VLRDPETVNSPDISKQSQNDLIVRSPGNLNLSPQPHRSTDLARQPRPAIITLRD